MKFLLKFIGFLVFAYACIYVYVVLAFIPSGLKSYGDLSLVLAYFLLGIILFRMKLVNRRIINYWHFSLFMSCSFLLNGLLHGNVSIFNAIAPLGALGGFVIVKEMKWPRIYWYFLVTLYVLTYSYFYFIYYRYNQISLIVSEAELDVSAFSNTSSNLIPVMLINSLFVYDVIAETKGFDRSIKVRRCFALLNFILILLQRSRAGIIISFVQFVILLLRNKSRRWIYVASFLSGLMIILNLGKILSFFQILSDATGGMELSSYSTDVRKENFSLFFDRMDGVVEFFFGYGKAFQEMTDAATVTTLVNIWNYSGLLLVMVVLSLVFRFLLLRGALKYKLLLTAPLIYSFFEGFYFAGYWDFALLLMYDLVLRSSKNLDSDKRFV